MPPQAEDLQSRFVRHVVLIFLIGTFVPFLAGAQTGPGGVGSTTGVSSLGLWLDSKRVNLNGTNPAIGTAVTTWFDKSGNNRNVSENLSGVATYRAQGVEFNNIGYLAGSDTGFPTGNAARTVFVVAYSVTTNTDDVLFFYGSAVNNQSYGILKITSDDGTAPNGIRNYFFGNDFNVNNNTWVGTTLRVITATYTNNTQSVRVDNGTASTQMPTVPNTVLGGTQGLQIGGWSSFGLYSQATIGEVIFHNTLLNTAQINIINNYLAAKYGLATTTELYDNDNSINGNYDFDVAGIGQESSGSHTDAQSSIVRINSAAGMANGRYYLWGHDNTAITATTNTNIPATVQARLSRIWRGSKTGAITTFNVTFDLTGMGPVTTNQLRLLIDTDNDGLFSDETVAGVIGGASKSGNTYTFSGVTIPNDCRFTIATTNAAVTPLPVTLVSFNAERHNNEVHINWSTATELNSDYFEVERSENGKEWASIDHVAAAGNSKNVNTYQSIDPFPIQGTNYYRLKQVDFDGTFEYFPITRVDFLYANAAYPKLPAGLYVIKTPKNTVRVQRW